MEQSIEEGNFLIATKLMGYTYPDKENQFFKLNILDLHNYHEDWNLLMPVVEKIDTFHERNNGDVYCQTNATSHSFYINYNDGKVVNEIHPKYYNGRHRSENESRIENVFLAIVDFITWYSSTQKK